MPFLFDQGFGAGFALFHDEFVERGIDRQRIVTGETGETEFVYRPSGRAHHSFDIEITETVDPKICTDFFHRHLVRDQLLRIGKIDAVVTSEPVRRTTHSHVHFLRAGLAQIYYPSTRSRATHNGI